MLRTQHIRPFRKATFYRWSRTNFAIFASLGKVIRIAALKIEVYDLSALKSGATLLPLHAEEDTIAGEHSVSTIGEESICKWCDLMTWVLCVWHIITSDNTGQSRKQRIYLNAANFLHLLSSFPASSPAISKTTLLKIVNPLRKHRAFQRLNYTLHKHTKIMIDIHVLKDKILDGYLMGKSEALALAQTHEKEALYHAADEVRAHFCGNTFELCAITNAKSGNCPQDCKWCSQSVHHNTDIEKYKQVDEDTALEQALYNDRKKVNRLSLVSSGRRATTKELKHLTALFRKLRQQTQLHLCASLGLLDINQMQQLKESGVSTYHCNLETSAAFFPKVCTTHTYEDKTRTIRAAQQVGLSICSGGIIGMGESMEDRIDLALTLQQLKVMSIPVNLLTAVEGTALAPQVPLSEEEVGTTFALFRLINPRAHIRFAAGRILMQSYQQKVLKAGVNAAIVGDLLTTIGTSIDEDKTIFSQAGYELVSND